MSTEAYKGVLSDYAFYVKEHIAVSSLDGDHYFSTENMLPNRGGVCRAASLPEQEKAVRVEAGDVLISNIRPYFKKIWLAKELAGCSNDVLCIRAKSMCLPEFLFYYLSSDTFFDYVMTGAKGTKMPRGDKQQIMHFHVLIPSLDIQKQVISILSCIDKKIQLNAQINRNLEKQAQAIFKSWFVDFEPFGSSIPSDWVEISFGAFLKPRSEKSNDVSIPLFSVTDTGIYPRDEKFNKKLSKSTTKNKIAYCTDIIFGMSREILNWGIMRAPIGCVSSAYNVYSVSDMVNSKYLESFIKSHSQSFQDLIGPASREGQGIDKAALLAKTIYLPTNDVLTNYYAIEDALTETIKIHESENKRLILLRDTLLPKLMSGEIDVSEVEV